MNGQGYPAALGQQYYETGPVPWYQHTLADGITVDEAQPGNYYMVNGVGAGPEPGPNLAVLGWSAVSTASMAASAYHGYKRNESVGWALWWGLMGAMFPIITPVIGVAQGFGKRKR